MHRNPLGRLLEKQAVIQEVWLGPEILHFLTSSQVRLRLLVCEPLLEQETDDALPSEGQAGLSQL